ncbi:MAG: hypothetical protein C5B46_01775 [Proteobacteria bacterium]|nr:MAG: hypothetical protein C5B46_01775 [Pseudomonadota bacterium]
MKGIADARLFSVAAVISVVAATAQAGEVVHYGRAGGAVGADRLQELRAVQRPAVEAQPQTTSPQWYGRAGYPIGADVAAARRNPSQANAGGSGPRPTVYGRAGVPLPFGG